MKPLKCFRAGAAILVVAAVSGCRDYASTNPALATSSRGYYDSNRLYQLIKPGMPKRQVIELFGKPLLEKEVQPGITCLDYVMFPEIPSNPDESDLGGFQVLLQNNLVQEWRPVLAAFNPRPSIRPTNYLTNNEAVRLKGNVERKLNFYVVLENPIEGGWYIDTPEFPKLGYIRASPDLIVTRLEDVQQKPSDSTERVLVRLRTPDSKLLTAVSEKNVGKQLLIVVGDEPVAAPYIRSPLTTEWLMLNLPKGQGTLIEDLKRLVSVK